MSHPYPPVIAPRKKPCTRCGGPGPFWRDRAYWSSRCVICRQAVNTAMAPRYRVSRRASNRAWSRAKRFREARALVEVAPTRQLVNFLGRIATPPGSKWCAYGQHACQRTAFHHVRTSPDGLAYVCKACHKIQQALARIARNGKGIPHGS